MTQYATLPELSLSQAAKLTGKSKSTINRAIKTGKISATRHNDGSYSIDPSELSRAFNLEPQEGSKRRDAEPDGNRLLERIEALEAMLNREREISADLKEDRDRWRQQANALLTDQRSPASNGSRWWPWRRKNP
jgi:excisionase family DNA binding protein